MTRRVRLVFVLLATLLGPAVGLAAAQGQASSIAGVVRDNTGAVMPGVTVEASSPALIEKTRTAVTDATGQYRLESLRPGTYTVVFNLVGFGTVKREGIELSGSFTATVNAELKVGAVEETITVTANSPIVDVQNAVEQRVMNHEVIDSVPVGAKNYYSVSVLQPGVTTTAQDVGGYLGDAMTSLSAHGSSTTDFRPMQNGVPVGTLISSGGLSGSVLNSQAAQEITVDTAFLSAELEEGGPRINYIPRDGGNRFTITGYGNFSTNALQASNLTPAVVAAGLPTVDSLKTLWEVSPGIGGPLLKDKIWFYGSGRYTTSDRYVGGMWTNANAMNPNPLVYEVFNPVLTDKVINHDYIHDRELRITWQAQQRLKVAAHAVVQDRCGCPAGITSTVSPEAANTYPFPISDFLFLDWSAPLSSRFLVEGTFSLHTQRFGNEEMPQSVQRYGTPSMTDQATCITYGSRATYQNDWDSQPFYRFSASYITGAHSFKAGMSDMLGYVDGVAYQFNPIGIRLNNGVPNQITERAVNYEGQSHENNLGVFAQDKWTGHRLTLIGGVRFDYFGSNFPEQVLGPGLLFPDRHLVIPAQDDLSWKDITPRFGAVYDPVGDAKTAIRVGVAKYLLGQGLNGLASNPNPVNTLSSAANRSWTDANHNGIPDCSYLTVAANGECGQLSDANFGSLVPGATYDPNILTGWGHRQYNWEFSAGIQRQIAPMVSVDVGYYRRWFGNFWAVQNLATPASAYNQFTITAPQNPLLPNGGGYPVTAYDLNPAYFGLPSRLYSTLSDSIGEWTDHWNGFDFNVNARVHGVLLQGGESIGRRSVNNCDLISKDPEMLSYVATGAEVTGNQAGAAPGTIVTPGTWQTTCSYTTPWSAYTQTKLLASYTVPRVGIILSGTFQSLPGPQLSATYAAANSLVAPALGRNLSGNAANTSINIIPAGTLYGDRLNQLDLRFGKRLTLGEAAGRPVKGTVNFDVYNVLNTDVAIQQSATYGTIGRPTQLLPGRFAKIGVQFDF